MHRLTDQYGPIPYSKVIENRQNSLAVAGGVIESNSDNAQFKPAVNRTVICFSEWKQHLISADLDSYMNGYADPRRAGMGCLALRFSGRVSAAAATLEPRVAAPCQTCQNSCPEPLTFMVELSGPSRVPSPRFRSRVVVPSGLWTKGGSSAARSCVPSTEFEEPPPVEEIGELLMSANPCSRKKISAASGTASRSFFFRSR